MKSFLYFIVAMFALVLAACGGNDESSNDASETNIKAGEVKM